MSDKKPIDSYDKPAGGWDALKSSWHALREQQVVLKGAGTLLRANQPRGFDCPGCAWPDRNPHSTFEFCENGVKAVANEATSKRVTPRILRRPRRRAGWRGRTITSSKHRAD